MDALFQQQQTTASLIQRFLTNTNKAGQATRTRGFLQGRIELLKAYWEKFQRTHDQMLYEPEASAHEYMKTDAYSAMEIKYSEVLGALYDLIPKAEAASTARTKESQPTPSSPHLPRINLPKFSGSYLVWESFRDMFISLIHDNSSLSNVQKLHYLKSSLTGEAEPVVRNIAITDANYVGAWTTLKSRYDNKHLLLHHHLLALKSLAPVSSESATELKRLVDGTNEAVRALEALGRPVQHWDDWLISNTIQNLDSTTRKDWETSLGDTNAFRSLTSSRSFCKGESEP